MKFLRDVEQLAFDRGTARRVDEDGRLHVDDSNISRANICEYRGSEIPNWSALGLAQDKLYRLLRDPNELQKAAPTFNNLPILRQHVHVTAEAPRHDLVVGSTGTHAAFDGEHLRNSLVFWDGAAIDDIKAERAKELSSSYRYEADMTPGTYAGQAYDGRMINIRGNHVAVVPKGRAGPTVVVNDAALPRPRMFGLTATKFRRFGG